MLCKTPGAKAEGSFFTLVFNFYPLKLIEIVTASQIKTLFKFSVISI